MMNMTIDETISEQPKRLLFVDDTMTVGSTFRSSVEFVMKKFMEKNHYETDIASSEEEALEYIAQKQYDVVFTDGNLRSGQTDFSGGIAVAKAAKEKESYVVGISSTPTQFAQVAKDSLDVNYKKPFGFIELFYLIKEKPTHEEFEKYERDQR